MPLNGIYLLDVKSNGLYNMLLLLCLQSLKLRMVSWSSACMQAWSLLGSKIVFFSDIWQFLCQYSRLANHKLVASSVHSTTKQSSVVSLSKERRKARQPKVFPSWPLIIPHITQFISHKAWSWPCHLFNRRLVLCDYQGKSQLFQYV